MVRINRRDALKGMGIEGERVEHYSKDWPDCSQCGGPIPPKETLREERKCAGCMSDTISGRENYWSKK